jgi:hypothetical protein
MAQFTRLAQFVLVVLATVASAQRIVLTNDDGWAVAQIRAEYNALQAAGYEVCHSLLVILVLITSADISTLFFFFFFAMIRWCFLHPRTTSLAPEGCRYLLRRDSLLASSTRALRSRGLLELIRAIVRTVI